MVALSPGFDRVVVKRAPQVPPPVPSLRSVLLAVVDERQTVEALFLSVVLSERVRVPVAKVDPAFVVDALNVANVPAPNADPARETRSTASRSFLTVVTWTVSTRRLRFPMAAPGGSAWDAINRS
jgi:hypothetical protein